MKDCTFRPLTKDFSKVEKLFSVKKNKKFEEDMGMINENKRGYTSVKSLGV